MHARKLWSVYRSTSPSTLYTDIVKIQSKHRVNSVLGLNPSEADKNQSKTVKDCDKSNVQMQNKVSINDVRFGSISSKNNLETGEQKHVGFNKVSRTGVVMKLNNNVNNSEQDCVDITHVNCFAVLCVDSS